jgi:hypothetical protein
MAFGTQQINKPTPQWVILAVRIISISSGALIAWVAQTNLLPQSAKNEIGLALGSIVSIVHLLAPMFGVQIDSATVPTQDVTAVKS